MHKKPSTNLVGPDFIDHLNKLVVDHESDGNIQADTTKTWHCAFIESRLKQTDK